MPAMAVEPLFYYYENDGRTSEDQKIPNFAVIGNNAVKELYLPSPKIKLENVIIDWKKYQPTYNGWCVSFVRQHGFMDYNGDAWMWKKFINSNVPSVGSVVVLNEGPLGHIAIVVAVDETRILIVEQNYYGKWIVSKRIISQDYVAIKGYITKANP